MRPTRGLSVSAWPCRGAAGHRWPGRKYKHVPGNQSQGHHWGRHQPAVRPKLWQAATRTAGNLALCPRRVDLCHPGRHRVPSSRRSLAGPRAAARASLRSPRRCGCPRQSSFSQRYQHGLGTACACPGPLALECLGRGAGVLQPGGGRRPARRQCDRPLPKYPPRPKGPILRVQEPSGLPRSSAARCRWAARGGAPAECGAHPHRSSRSCRRAVRPGGLAPRGRPGGCRHRRAAHRRCSWPGPESSAHGGARASRSPVG